MSDETQQPEEQTEPNAGADAGATAEPVTPTEATPEPAAEATPEPVAEATPEADA